jgi:hypothetical protein
LVNDKCGILKKTPNGELINFFTLT